MPTRLIPESLSLSAIFPTRKPFSRSRNNASRVPPSRNAKCQAVNNPGIIYGGCGDNRRIENRTFSLAKQEWKNGQKLLGDCDCDTTVNFTSRLEREDK